MEEQPAGAIALIRDSLESSNLQYGSGERPTELDTPAAIGGTAMIVLLLALLIGVVAGLRAFTALAAASWAAYFGWLPLSGTPLAFTSSVWAVGVLSALAMVEYVTDQLPMTPSRTVPMLFGARIAFGALSGAAIGAPGGWLIPGGIAGIVGAVIGTFGGHAARRQLATAFRKDMPAAFIEDAVAIIAAVLIILLLR
jgi:uncharacterized membrane protein